MSTFVLMYFFCTFCNLFGLSIRTSMQNFRLLAQKLSELSACCSPSCSSSSCDQPTCRAVRFAPAKNGKTPPPLSAKLILFFLGGGKMTLTYFSTIHVLLRIYVHVNVIECSSKYIKIKVGIMPVKLFHNNKLL